MAGSSVSLISLPNELIYSIIDFARPHGFQNLLLACKHIYAVGRPLINDYNLGRRWVSYSIQGRTSGSQPITLLQLQQTLPATPKKVQEWIGLYVNQVNLRRVSSRRRSGIILSSRPIPHTSIPSWLRDELNQIINECPELKPERRANLVVKKPAPDQCIEWHSDLWLSLSGRRCGYGTFTQLPALFLFANLHRLSLQVEKVPFGMSLKEKSAVDSHVILGRIIKRHHGRRYFQQLEELKVDENGSAGIKFIAPWMLLPNLKALMVHGLHDYGQHTDSMLAKILPAEFKSSIQHLVLPQVILKEKTMRKLLSHIGGLRTLVWQHVKHDLPDRSFRPNVLARLLVRSSSQSLRCLVMTTKNGDQDPIATTKQIHHFKRFSKLTHIAIDSKLLRPKNISSSEELQRCKARSLTKVLPRQIEVLAIHFKEDRPGILRAVLRYLGRKISLFPNLHLIEIRFVGSKHRSPDFFKQFKSMQRRLQSVNVSLEWGCSRDESANFQSNMRVVKQITSMDWFFEA